MSIPAKIPITAAPATVTVAQPAVIATSPPRVPLSVMEMSGFLYFIHVTIMAAIVEHAAAMFVVTNTRLAVSSSPSRPSVDAGLKPNHPNQRINTPSAPSVRL